MQTPTPQKQAIYDNFQAQNKGYNKDNFQSHYGIGNVANVGNGFNQFNNVDALQTEIGRINQVMGNRTGFGLGNDQYTGYLDKLNNYNAPFQQQQNNIQQAQDQYKNSQAAQDAQKWNNASISDIAAKYGFDYSRDYAKQQAEAEAQALRNANLDAQRRNESNSKVGKQNIDNNLMNMVEALDRNYFQKMMGQQQDQVETGMNAGIASDQDLRMQMARQAEMGSSYRDANLGKMQIDENFNLNDLRLAEAMGLIDQQSLAREDSLYNDRLQQGYGQLMNEREMSNALDQQMWGRSQAEIDRALNQQNILRGAGQWQDAFNYGKERDQISDQQWNKQFDWGKLMDEAGLSGMYNGNRTMQGQQFDWGKQMDEAGLMGLFNGNRTLQGQQFDWGKTVDQHGMTMDEKRFGLQQQQFNQSVANARAKAAGSGGGGGSTNKPTAQAAPKKLAQDFLKEMQNVPQTPEDKKYLQYNSGPIKPPASNFYGDWLDKNMFHLGRYGG